MHYIIDRFEGSLAICEAEDQTMVTIERSKLPPEALEGDCLRFQDNRYIIDQEMTSMRKLAMQKRMKKLFS